MVTAIVVPIILIYFYWLTKKEMKLQDEKWLAAGQVPEEAVLKGEIISVIEEKQRFYFQRYLLVQTIKLQTNDKAITAIKTTPMTNTLKKDIFRRGDMLVLFGSWENNRFFINKYEKVTD